MSEPKRFLVCTLDDGDSIVTADCYSTKYWSADFWLGGANVRSFHRDTLRSIRELEPGEEPTLRQPAFVYEPDRVDVVEERVEDLERRLTALAV